MSKPTMGHQKKKRPMLEPVLENYMGSPISYNSEPRKPRHGAKVAPSEGRPALNKAAASSSSSLNPWHIFGKLRDRYVRAMNEMAVGGDYAAVAGYHGCVPESEYPGVGAKLLHREDERRHEMEALRKELAALRRN